MINANNWLKKHKKTCHLPRWKCFKNLTHAKLILRKKIKRKLKVKINSQ